jgi:KDO2-lipid IV(A) lauroyltransferase
VTGRQALEARAAAAVSALVRALPRRWVLALGRGLGRLLGDLDRRHVVIAADNLRRAFPDWDRSRVLRTARSVYAHFGQVLLDIVWMAGRSRDEILGLVDLERREHVEAARAEGRGVVLVTAHIGNWELSGLAHGWLFGPIGVVARPLDNPALDRRLNAFRESGGNEVISKFEALREVMRRLRDGGAVGILLDQNVQEKDGIFVEFFGRPAATTTVAAALAVKTGCALLLGHTEIKPGGRYRLVYDPPVRWSPSGDREDDVRRLTQILTRHIEGWVRQAPEQWLWIHRRWKTQPVEHAALSAQSSATDT